MSFIRAGHDLEDFEGQSEAYVFLGQKVEGDCYFEDYDNKYEDNATFAQLMLNFIKRLLWDDLPEEECKKVIDKFKRILGEKLNVKTKENNEIF